MVEPFMETVDAATSVELEGKVIAGKVIEGPATSTLTTVGKNSMLTHLMLNVGFDQDGHLHPDHESIGYVISGKIEMRIGDEVHMLGPGSTWYHPKGVEHTCKPLEDSEVLEFHAPLRQDILELFDL